jgi:ubiquinone/menaquinone biosynthesis C-methylase UbiE
MHATITDGGSAIAELEGPMSSAKWDAGLYDAKHSFVWERAKGVMELLSPQPGERILDVGCGTGALSADIAATAAEIVGVDRSEEMIQEARRKYPALRFEVCDARALSFSNEFDAVFSNATLHWMPDAEPVVRGISRALRPGGRLVAEFGGKGNVRSVVEAFETALHKLRIPVDGANPWFYPSIAEYSSLLEKHGLEVREAALFARPTKLEDGERGFETWVTMFGAAFLERVPEPHRADFLRFAEQAARPGLWKSDHWELDYRRLRVAAWKNLR